MLRFASTTFFEEHAELQACRLVCLSESTALEIASLMHNIGLFVGSPGPCSPY